MQEAPADLFSDLSLSPANPPVQMSQQGRNSDSFSAWPVSNTPSIGTAQPTPNVMGSGNAWQPDFGARTPDLSHFLEPRGMQPNID